MSAITTHVCSCGETIRVDNPMHLFNAMKLHAKYCKPKTRSSAETAKADEAALDALTEKPLQTPYERRMFSEDLARFGEHVAVEKMKRREAYKSKPVTQTTGGK